MRRLMIAALLAASGSAYADFRIPGFELVQTTPVETTLANADLRDPLTVWSELFDQARSEIVIGQFYAASKPGAPFEKVIERLEAAGKRGVKIRFLLDQKGVGLSDPATLERLQGDSEPRTAHPRLQQADRQRHHPRQVPGGGPCGGLRRQPEFRLALVHAHPRNRPAASATRRSWRRYRRSSNRTGRRRPNWRPAGR
jgi:hypothetical protein